MKRWVLRLLPPLILLLAALAMPHRLPISDGAPEMAVVKAITAVHTAEILASGQKGGFKLTLRLTPTGYEVAAAPLRFGTTGKHTYFSDQSMAIHQHNGREAATPADPFLGDPARWPGHAACILNLFA
jgi:hypothetical protein